MINITARHIAITPELNSFIHQSFRKLTNALNNYTIHLVITKLKDRIEASCNLHHEGTNYHATKTAGDSFAAVEGVAKSILKQLFKSKSKKYVKVKPDFNIPGNQKRKTITPPLLSIDEAMNILNQNGYRFYVFRDESKGSLCICYKKDSGENGILEIEEEI